MSSPQKPELFHVYKGTRIPPVVTESAVDALEKFQVRQDDIFVASYPKSGTHWISEVINLILVDGDARKLDHRHRRACLEITDTTDLSRIHESQPGLELVQTDPSPRVLLTHLRPGHLPKEAWDKRSPIIYILRNPKDACLSMFEFSMGFTLPDGQPYLRPEDFDKFLQDFASGNVAFDGWCEHVMSYEALYKKGENVLFVTYEDMKKDLPAVIKSVAKHIGRDVSNEVIDRVVKNTTMDAMRENYKSAMEARKQEAQRVEAASLFMFLHKGISGRWKLEFSEDRWTRLDTMFKEKVKDSMLAKQYFSYGHK